MNRTLAALLGRLYREGEGGGDGGGSGGGGSGGGSGGGDSSQGGGGAGGAGDGGGAGGAGDGGQGGGEGQGGQGGQGGEGGTGSGSLVADARRAAEGTAPATIPEKYQVKDKDGKVDEKATQAKLVAAHLDLEKRMGASGGAPPAKVEDYKLELGEGEKELPKFDAKMDGKFRALAIAAGLNNKQYNAIARGGDAYIRELIGGMSEDGYAQARATLVTHYGGLPQLEQAQARAYQAFAAFAREEDMAEIDSIGNHPVFIRVFDRIAAELPEDRLPNFNVNQANADKAEVERLQGDLKSAYWNERDPGHAAAVAKVTAWNQRQTGASKAAFSVG